MKVRELMDILGELDQELDVWFYVSDEWGGFWERLDKRSIDSRNGRVEIG